MVKTCFETCLIHPIWPKNAPFQMTEKTLNLIISNALEYLMIG